jgi:hypothetical protein
MSIIQSILNGISIPPMVRIRQKFDATYLVDPIAVLRQELQKPGAMDQILPGQSVALAIGSRGIANIAEVAKVTIDVIKKAGAYPFIVPCMGSHGGATAEGQIEVLKQLGITEQFVGAPIRASMDVIQIEQMPNGLPVYVDRIASQADAIVIINRIKPHTAFRGRIESGIMKMIAIGLGKQKGADACHQSGYKNMAENVIEMSRILIHKLPIRFGIALVENAYDQTCRIEVLLPPDIEHREVVLLGEAKERMAKLLFTQVDVLVIDYLGKNISGDGMDPNITGRYPTPYAEGGPEVSKMVVLDLTPETKGNANGVGLADFTTKRLVDKIDKEATYANALTSTDCDPSKIPMTLANDFEAIKAGVKTCNILNYSQCRMVRIRDTLHIGEIEISVPMLEEASAHSEIEIVSKPYEFVFDEIGNLLNNMNSYSYFDYRK